MPHFDLTTDEVVSGIIEWLLPPVLLLKTWQKVGSSINMEVINDTETIVMKVRMIGPGNNGFCLNRINPPLSPYMSAYLSVLLVALILASTCFFFFACRPQAFFSFSFLFLLNATQRYVEEEQARRRAGRKRKKTNPNPNPPPPLF